MREFLFGRHAIGHSPTYAVIDRSLWLGVVLNQKPLALTQCCSARIWHSLSISSIGDLLICGRLGSWEELYSKYNIPPSHKKTYTLICKATGMSFSGKVMTSEQFIDQLKWVNDTSFHDINAK